MPVLIICKFEENLIKTEGVIVSTIFFSSTQGQATPKLIVLSGPRIKFVIDFMPFLVTCKFEEDSAKVSKMKELSCAQHFPHYKYIGASGCHGNQSFAPICPKTLQD